MSTIKISKDEGKRAHVWIKSAIGTPNRRQYPHKNIMFPYFRMYKSPYRARDSRTRKAFWPCVDKYPWHTHQKRWVKAEDLNVKFFAEFTNRDPSNKNLFETCHTLPLNGMNCLFWRPCYEHSHKCLSKQGNTRDETSKKYEVEKKSEDSGTPIEGVMKQKRESESGCRVIQINNFYYIVTDKSKDNLYFYLKYITYTMRPFRGKMLGDIYLYDKKIRHNVSSEGIINGEWKYAFPHIPINAKMENMLMDSESALQGKTQNVEVQDLVIVDKFTYRPPLPKPFSSALMKLK